VPTPSKPELEESDNAAFPYLQKLTEPERIAVERPSGIGCAGAAPLADSASTGVTVLDEKLVAGFKAVVLESTSAGALSTWLKDHDYVYSPAVEVWAKPYIEANWKITALKVAKDKDDKQNKRVDASALRMSFTTDRPLFPYREPDYGSPAETLEAKNRLLRIYLVADAKYQGKIGPDVAWTGKVAWANKISAGDRDKTLELLNLPRTTGPAEWWMTEFEDKWPYQPAKGDVWFSRSAEQDPVKRNPIVYYKSSSAWPTDIWVYAIGAAIVVLISLGVFRRVRHRRH
jgi:hypothetical protein